MESSRLRWRAELGSFPDPDGWVKEETEDAWNKRALLQGGLEGLEGETGQAQICRFPETSETPAGLSLPVSTPSC